jgi:CPA1 family monovalent cation:H+ antiporter
VVVLEGESLLNDASALVLYRFAVAATLAGEVSLGEASLSFLVSAVGGTLLGYVVGRVAIWIFTHLEDTLLDILVSFLAGFAAYIAAEHIHVSGVLAAVACGLVLGQRQHGAFTARTRLEMRAVWEFVEFVLTGPHLCSDRPPAPGHSRASGPVQSLAACWLRSRCLGGSHRQPLRLGIPSGVAASGTVSSAEGARSHASLEPPDPSLLGGHARCCQLGGSLGPTGSVPGSRHHSVPGLLRDPSHARPPRDDTRPLDPAVGLGRTRGQALSPTVTPEAIEARSAATVAAMEAVSEKLEGANPQEAAVGNDLLRDLGHRAKQADQLRQDARQAASALRCNIACA